MNIITMTGKKITLPFTYDIKCINIKEYIFKKEQIPCNLQRLIYCGKEIADEMIINYDTLYLVLKLRGGMFHETSGRNDMSHDSFHLINQL